jgi:hypothetical protein
MTDRMQHAQHQASTEQFCRFWSANVDALERHLSAKMWALAAAGLVLTTYPIARIVGPAVLHALVPDMVWTVLNMI